MTIWKPIPGYEGLYQVSDDGQIQTRDRYGEFIRKAIHADKNGYFRVTLSLVGVKKSYLVHHLVLTAFVGPKPEGMECRHLNGIPGDNRLENLQWGTSSENSYDVVKHGNHPYADKTHCKNGHEFTAENTMQRSDGGRQCRECNKERARAWYETHKGPRQPNNKDKTHCKRGHEFTPENTYWRKDGRQCRACTIGASKARYEANKTT
jgi:hypothetical protein